MNKQEEPNQTPVTQLFSNLKFENNQFKHQPGSVFGNTALIVGTTIGAGSLGLPAVTLTSGIIPSTILLIIVWVYTLISGLLIAELTLNVMSSIKSIFNLFKHKMNRNTKKCLTVAKSFD